MKLVSGGRVAVYLSIFPSKPVTCLKEKEVRCAWSGVGAGVAITDPGHITHLVILTWFELPE